MRAAFEHGMSAEGDADSFLAGLFMRDVKRLPLLSKDEESILMKRSATGDKGAEKKLIESNLRFVLKTAFSYYLFFSSPACQTRHDKSCSPRLASPGKNS